MNLWVNIIYIVYIVYYGFLRFDFKTVIKINIIVIIIIKNCFIIIIMSWAW